LAYVYVRSNVALQSNLHRITGQIRGRLNWLFQHANLELNRLLGRKCVETRGSASHWDDGIVRHSMKVEITEKIAVILLGAVALDKISAFMEQFIKQTSQIRGNLNQLWHGNPELNGRQLPKCVETRGLVPARVMG